jgi:hypothetical protein
MNGLAIRENRGEHVRKRLGQGGNQSHSDHCSVRPYSRSVNEYASTEKNAPRRRWLGAVSLVFGALGILVIGGAIIWTLVSGAGGFAIMGIMPIAGPALLVTMIIGLAFGCAGVAFSKPRGVAITGLIFSATPLVMVLVVFAIESFAR